MQGSSEFRTAVGDEGEGLGEIVFAHGGLEIGEGFVFGPSLLVPPVHEEADHHSPKHAQNQKTVGVEHLATIVMERDVQALMAAVFNPPALSVGLEPL
jgi:hypothetical protein